MPNVESDITIEAVLSDECGSVRVRAADNGSFVYIKPLQGLDGDGEVCFELQALVQVALALGIKLER